MYNSMIAWFEPGSSEYTEYMQMKSPNLIYEYNDII